MRKVPLADRNYYKGTRLPGTIYAYRRIQACRRKELNVNGNRTVPVNGNEYLKSQSGTYRKKISYLRTRVNYQVERTVTENPI